MDYVRVKEEPVDEPPSDRRIPDAFLQFRRENEEIISLHVNELEERAIRGAVGRYHHRKVLREKFGDNDSNSSAAQLSEDVEMEEVGKAGKEEGKERLNSDEELARRRREQARRKRARSEKKRRKRGPVPADTWLPKVSDTVMDAVEAEPSSLCRKKHQMGFIGSVKKGEVFIDENNVIQVKQAEETPQRTEPEDPNQEEDLSLIVQEYFLKNDDPPTGDPENVLDACSDKVVFPSNIYDLSLRKDPEVRKKGVSVPQARDLYEQLSRMLIGERTERECIYFTEMHLQQMTSVGEEFTPVIAQLARDRQHNVPISMLTDRDRLHSNLERHSRAMEEMFLREPLPGERPCVEGDQCEGYMIPGAFKRVALVEYQTMEEIMYHREHGKWRGKRKHCIMCMRKLASFGYFFIKSQCVAYDSSMLDVGSCMADKRSKPLIIAPFSNLVGQDEYSIWDVIISSSSKYLGLIEPVVIHVRWRYQQEMRDGVAYFVQKYEKPQRNLDSRDTSEFGADWTSGLLSCPRAQTPYSPPAGIPLLP